MVILHRPDEGADLRDRRWTERHATVKARTTIRRLKDGKASFRKASNGQSVAPTYPDHAKPVADARRVNEGAIRQHLKAGVGVRAIRVATGVGKTRTAAKLVAEEVKQQRAKGEAKPFLYCVPRHRLGDEIERSSEGTASRPAFFVVAPPPTRIGRGNDVRRPCGRADRARPRRTGLDVVLQGQATETAQTVSMRVLRNVLLPAADEGTSPMFGSSRTNSCSSRKPPLARSQASLSTRAFGRPASGAYRRRRAGSRSTRSRRRSRCPRPGSTRSPPTLSPYVKSSLGRCADNKV